MVGLIVRLVSALFSNSKEKEDAQLAADRARRLEKARANIKKKKAVKKAPAKKEFKCPPDESFPYLPILDNERGYPIESRIKHSLDYMAQRGLSPIYFKGLIAGLWAAEVIVISVLQGMNDCIQFIYDDEMGSTLVAVGLMETGIKPDPDTMSDKDLDTTISALASVSKEFPQASFEQEVAKLFNMVNTDRGILEKLRTEFQEGDPFEQAFAEPIKAALSEHGLTYISTNTVFSVANDGQAIIHVLCVEKNELLMLNPDGEMGLFNTGVSAHMPATFLSDILALEKDEEGFQIVRQFPMPSQHIHWVTGYDQLAMMVYSSRK